MKLKKKIVMGGAGLFILAIIGIVLCCNFRDKEDDYEEISFVEEGETLGTHEIMLLGIAESWGLSPSDEMMDIREHSQKYLNQYHDGMQIDSAEFNDYVHYMFYTLDDYTAGLEDKAAQDAEFGRFYFYASMYSNCADAELLEEYGLNEALLAMNVEEIIHWFVENLE